jgi:DNA-binding LytR/AlgR family response regulator
MKVDVKIDSTCEQPHVVIYTAEMDEEVRQVLAKLGRGGPQVITGSRGELVEILSPDSILRVYSSAGKVYAQTEKGEYLLKLRLYEAEARLPQDRFVRISNSEIVNLRRVTGFDVNLSGTIGVQLANGEQTYVSRRYVPRIKAILGI